MGLGTAACRTRRQGDSPSSTVSILVAPARFLDRPDSTPSLPGVAADFLCGSLLLGWSRASLSIETGRRVLPVDG